jgi:hypothetical protein
MSGIINIDRGKKNIGKVHCPWVPGFDPVSHQDRSLGAHQGQESRCGMVGRALERFGV